MTDPKLLDAPARYGDVDRADAGALIRDLPDQLERGVALGGAGAPPPSLERIVVCGMGGSGVAGRVAAAYLRGRLPLPLLVVRDFDCPAWVNERTLAVVITYSGNTLETLTAAEGARARGAALVFLSSGGQAAALAARYGFPHIALPPGRPPRCALGFMAGALLAYLGRGGWFAFPGVAGVAAHLRGCWEKWGFEVPVNANAAKALAVELAAAGGIAVYGSAPLGAVAAERCRTQLEENAKVLAAGHAFPELCHNELVAFERPTAAARALHVLCFRAGDESAAATKQVGITLDLIRPVVSRLTELKAAAADDLGALFELIYFGDLVSYYLALLRGVDPTPVAHIVQLKARLAA
jgi:glucose/mannose-6-phosphate isomerase